MTVCLDSWAVLAWLDGQAPAEARIEEELAARPIISWVNAVEVYCRIERRHGRRAADETLDDIRKVLEVDLPGVSRMVETARLRAGLSIALADCFAISTAAAYGLPLLTGDPEILEASGLPCSVEDLRPQRR